MPTFPPPDLLAVRPAAPASAPATATASSSTVTSEIANISTAVAAQALKQTVHYPSQDPARLGATQLHADCQE